MILEIDRKALEDHIKRVCRNNIKRSCKICNNCPFKKHVLRIMEENHWRVS